MACAPDRTYHVHYINDFQMIPTTISHLLQAAIPVCTILNTFVHAIGLLCTTHIDMYTFKQNRSTATTFHLPAIPSLQQ